MWVPNISFSEEEEEGEETWKLNRAFAEDTRSTNMGMPKWPPRSYICTFCRREFRSAQALGGHMNVHRRDRARLHHQTTLQTQAQARFTSKDSRTLFYHQSPNDSSSTNNQSPNDYNEMQEVNEMSNEVHEKEAPIEELDLELRLGHIPTPTSQHETLFQKNNTVMLSISLDDS